MNNPERRISTSVLVIGAGGSGLRAAIELAELGVDVLIVSKRASADAHTSLAAGGINAALATVDPEDSWQQHAADTLKESYLLADPDTVRIVTAGAARGIEGLERYGMRFAREEDGRISQRVRSTSSLKSGISDRWWIRMRIVTGASSCAARSRAWL